MSERISIAELRDIAAVASDDVINQSDFDAICDVVPALVEAVEALEDLWFECAEESERPSALRAKAVIDRFDFGDKP